MSSFGIIYALLSFLQDLGAFPIFYYNEKKGWIKGVSSIIIGILYYLIIGLPHLQGAKNR